jgi:glycosyltransferase involved in cell wall biosynthesis
MKILMISSIGYAGGGAENNIMLLKQTMEKMGHTVKILTSDLRPDLPRFNDMEFKSIDNRPMALKIFYRTFNPSSFFAVRKALEEFKPDIVHFHTMSQVTPSAIFPFKNRPAIMTVHGTEDYTRCLLLWSFPLNLFKEERIDFSGLTLKGWLHYFYHRYINGTVYRLIFKNIDNFITYSGHLRRNLDEENIKSTQIEAATKLYDYFPINPESSIIAYVGRLEKLKGVDHLIRSMPEIIKKCPSVKLKIAGTGNYMEELESLVKFLKLDGCIEFLGHIDREALFELYKEAAILVVPSVWPEPFGLVGIEAMSVGRPVIASNVGGISDWLADGETGFMVNPSAPDEISSNVIKLLNDKKLLKEFSLNSRKRSELFTIENQTEKTLEIYESAIKKYKSAS